MDVCFPEEGVVYDYMLDDAGISNFVGGHEDDQERKVCQLHSYKSIHEDE